MVNYKYDDIIKNVKEGWLPFFEENKEELNNILNTLNQMDDIIYPNEIDLFRALYYYSPKDIKVTILGQDCYISEEKGTPQAMGLCFSVPRNHTKVPPSLSNIYKEIKNCYPEYEIPKHGDLEKWASEEKILLLNCALTVKKGKSNPPPPVDLKVLYCIFLPGAASLNSRSKSSFLRVGKRTEIDSFDNPTSNNFCISSLFALIAL